MKDSPLYINSTVIAFRDIADYSIYKSCGVVAPKNLLYYSKFCAIAVTNEQNSVCLISSIHYDLNLLYFAAATKAMKVI